MQGMERLLAYKERLLSEAVRVDPERLKFLLEVYEQTEGQPTIIRRAKLVEKLLTEKSIFIDENPIVGSIANTLNAVYPCPEFSCTWMRREIEDSSLHVGLGPVGKISEEDRKLFLEAVDYWKDKCAFVRGYQIYNEIYANEASVGQLQGNGMWAELINSFPKGSISPDYEKVLKIGIRGIIKEVEAKVAELPAGGIESQTRRYFYKAALICLQALIKYSQRLAALAREKAERETEPDRKKELLRVADVCERVPADPARDFWDACQAVWLIYVSCQVETPTSAIVMGRLGQYLYPFYKRDREEGKITSEEAIRLLGWMFLKVQGHGMFYSSSNFRGNSGQISCAITLGGLTPEGKIASNEVEYLILETQRRLHLTQPTLTLLWDAKLPEEFLLECIDLIKTGIGQPMILSNSKMIEHFLNWYPGMTVEEARNGTNIGCVPTRPAHAHTNYWGGYPSMGKILELVLYNGKDPSSGVQLGIQTGDAEKFESYDELQQATDKQIAHFVDRGMAGHRITAGVYAELLPLPMQSCFIDDCIARGKDLQSGGARYSTDTLLPVGMIDLGNSLAAIKKLVFEEKRFPVKELKKALKANFEGNGYSEIHRVCWQAPKYGNDDPYVDSIVEHCYGVFAVEQVKYKDYLGNHTHPESYSISNHNGLGLKCGALPSGRKAKLPFSDATVSAYPGTDVNGPTALVRSATSVMDIGLWGSNHLNMKFHPSTIEGMQGSKNLLALVKTYCELGGKHIQFNCVDNKILKDAQLHPEKYKDLIVRVAGFSAYFIYLDKTVQDEIIKRTELKFG